MSVTDKRAAALAWAARGFRVFPLKAHSKEPLPGVSWPTLSTSDLAAIRQMWTDPATGGPAPYNIGVHVGEAIVVDVDVKHIGRAEALASLMDLEVPLDTLVVRTPSGGWHYYLSGPAVRNHNKGALGPGIDIRSGNGYVVAPGSDLAEGAYTLEQDTVVQPAPAAFVERVGRIGAKEDRASLAVAATASEANRIEGAVRLAEAVRQIHAAVPGERNHRLNAVAFPIFRLVREGWIDHPEAYATLEGAALDIGLEPEEIEKTLRSAWEGSLTANPPVGAEVFGGVTLPPAELTSAPETPVDRQLPLAFSAFSIDGAFKPRHWIVEGLLCRQVVSLLAASGSSGKTAFACTLAASVAMGLAFGPYPAGPAEKVLLIAAEETRDEMAGRMLATCMALGLDPQEVASRVAIVSNRKWKITSPAGRQQVANKDEIARIRNWCVAEGIGAIIVDPLRKTHTGEENDSGAMDSVMGAYADLAEEADVAMLLCHHASQGSRLAEPGEAASSRGSTAIVDAARIVVTLTVARKSDEVGAANERQDYSRLDDAKTNMTRKRAEPAWFKKVGQRDRNGTEMVAMVYEAAPRKAGVEDNATSLARAAVRAMRRVEATTILVRPLANEMMQDPVIERMLDDRAPKDRVGTLVTMIEREFWRPMDVADDGRAMRLSLKKVTVMDGRQIQKTIQLEDVAAGFGTVEPFKWDTT